MDTSWRLRLVRCTHCSVMNVVCDVVSEKRRTCLVGANHDCERSGQKHVIFGARAQHGYCRSCSLVIIVEQCVMPIISFVAGRYRPAVSGYVILLQAIEAQVELCCFVEALFWMQLVECGTGTNIMFVFP